MRRPRDSQRGKLYRAERELADLDEKIGKGTIAEAEAYVVSVWNTRWMRDHFPLAQLHAEPRVVDGRGTRRATGSLYRLNLPRWSRTKLVVLHEIAHAVTPNWCAAHGREFAANFIKLVQHYMGVETARALKQAFRANGVKYTKKRKISERRRQELREQLAAARPPTRS